MSKSEQPILNEKDIAIDHAIASAEDEFLCTGKIFDARETTGKIFDARETLAALRKKHFE